MTRIKLNCEIRRRPQTLKFPTAYNRSNLCRYALWGDPALIRASSVPKYGYWFRQTHMARALLNSAVERGPFKRVIGDYWKLFVFKWRHKRKWCFDKGKNYSILISWTHCAFGICTKSLHLACTIWFPPQLVDTEFSSESTLATFENMFDERIKFLVSDPTTVVCKERALFTRCRRSGELQWGLVDPTTRRGTQ